MSTLSEQEIIELLTPFARSRDVAARLTELALRFSIYLDLLLKWNSRTNLTAVRDPREIVQRHFGESVSAACVLFGTMSTGQTLLDLGSGAGFPGLPIQLCLPDVRVTLAESQGKKASFLREVVRTLGLTTEVWAGRAEAMPEPRSFDVVTLRAVDKMESAVNVAVVRVAHDGMLVVLGGAEVEIPEGWSKRAVFQITFGRQRYVSVLKRKGLSLSVDKSTGMLSRDNSLEWASR